MRKAVHAQHVDQLLQAGVITGVVASRTAAAAARSGLFRQQQDRDGESGTLGSLGYIAHHTGRDLDAVRNCGRAIEIFRDLGNSYGEAILLDNLGDPFAALGQRRHQEHQRNNEAARVQRKLDVLAAGRAGGPASG
ncbi:hypothetical protein AB0I53_01945 [Saccharopolyspora sp. NPDC050389]|uniref:hypothetical protein n=1 Tax=Saccharopolyspora sp. NPDC050389 TaxID=3155516 RepID=UPI0033C0FAF8